MDSSLAARTSLHPALSPRPTPPIFSAKVEQCHPNIRATVGPCRLNPSSNRTTLPTERYSAHSAAASRVENHARRFRASHRTNPNVSCMNITVPTSSRDVPSLWCRMPRTRSFSLKGTWASERLLNIGLASSYRPDMHNWRAYQNSAWRFLRAPNPG